MTHHEPLPAATASEGPPEGEREHIARAMNHSRGGRAHARASTKRMQIGSMLPTWLAWHTHGSRPAAAASDGSRVHTATGAPRHTRCARHGRQRESDGSSAKGGLSRWRGPPGCEREPMARAMNTQGEAASARAAAEPGDERRAWPVMRSLAGHRGDGPPRGAAAVST